MKITFKLITAATGLCMAFAMPSNAQQWTTNGTAIYNTNTGNVGIGTGATLPLEKLQVKNGSILLDHYSAGGNLFFGGKTNASVNGMRLSSASDGNGYFDIRSATLTNGLIFRLDNGIASTERMRICANGNVGINNATPAEKLDVWGNIKINDNTIYFRSGADNNHGISYRGLRPFAGIGIDGPVAFGWSGGALGSTSGGEKLALRWNEKGNVGIGTATPEDKLQVGSGMGKMAIGSAEGASMGYGTSYLGFNFARTTNGWLSATDGSHNGASTIYSNVIGELFFVTIPASGTSAQLLTDAAVVNNVKMKIYSNGKVLIGNPQMGGFKGVPNEYLLYVQKGILTENLKVAVATSNDWSDYVFNEDYKLRSVSELEAFIKENKHLPNIPSAEEVVKQGVDMAKMDAKLLEKIEELSLYIIEQNKRIQALEKISLQEKK